MKNEYKITKELMMSWAKEYHLHGKVQIFNFILYCLLLVCGVAMLLFNLVVGEWIYYYLAGLSLFVSIFQLFFSRFVVWKKRYKMFSKTYGVTEWMRTTEFTDEAIILTDHTSVSHIQYENIENIKEKGNRVMIYLNHNMALRIYKDAFIEGSWEECLEKIEAMRH